MSITGSFCKATKVSLIDYVYTMVEGKICLTTKTIIYTQNVTPLDSKHLREYSFYKRTNIYKK